MVFDVLAISIVIKKARGYFPQFHFPLILRNNICRYLCTSWKFWNDGNYYWVCSTTFERRLFKLWTCRVFKWFLLISLSRIYLNILYNSKLGGHFSHFTLPPNCRLPTAKRWRLPIADSNPKTRQNEKYIQYTQYTTYKMGPANLKSEFNCTAVCIIFVLSESFDFIWMVNVKTIVGKCKNPNQHLHISTGGFFEAKLQNMPIKLFFLLLA